MYLDVERLQALDYLKHLLREELTQALGLMNDSMKYRDSIFYQNFTRTNAYTEMDRELIRLLYLVQIRPGMNAAEVEEVLRNL
ncbi:MAG: DUF2927 domain-containing protein [Bacteroidia bacterium]|nr:DUF2927 domain-containing protein [Bacteroidia bacterium]